MTAKIIKNDNFSLHQSSWHFKRITEGFITCFIKVLSLLLVAN